LDLNIFSTKKQVLGPVPFPILFCDKIEAPFFETKPLQASTRCFAFAEAGEFLSHLFNTHGIHLLPDDFKYSIKARPVGNFLYQEDDASPFFSHSSSRSPLRKSIKKVDDAKELNL